MKIAEILSGLDGGGVENMLLNYCQFINRDKMQIDFIVHNQTKGAIEDAFLNLGCHVYHVTPKTKSMVKNTREIYHILKKEKYDVVHSHMNYKGASHMILAWLCGVKRRIIHQHTAHYPVRGIMKIIVPIAKKVTSVFSNVWMACSIDAAIDMYGVKNYNMGRVHILKDAIKTETFSFDLNNRIYVRNKFDLEDKFVIGMVGRFHPEKNHKFMLEIFRKILEINNNSILMLVGGGEMFDYYKHYIEMSDISDKVILTGIRNDVGILLQGMDAFVLPTKREGFGMVLIEAQCAGLPTFTSLEGVPKEVGITNLLHFISLNNTAEVWAKIIYDCSKKSKRESKQKEIIEAGYDIMSQKKMLENIYTSFL